MLSKSNPRAVLAASAVAVGLFGSYARADDAELQNANYPLPIRVVVVTTFDTGSDTDAPGEFNTWVVKYPLPYVIPFAQGYHHLRYNAEKQVLGIESGEGPTHMAASITALANDPRFDFSHAYWILAGIWRD